MSGTRPYWRQQRRRAETPRHPVHPRGCGEQARCSSTTSTSLGSSPRVRGTGSLRPAVAGDDRFIPAGAGNRRPTRWSRPSRPVHPRGCGEQARPSPGDWGICGSSPRVRGTGQELEIANKIPRFIPAGAGNSRPACPGTNWPPVHPRGCGEQSSRLSGNQLATGSSPRVRGTAGMAFQAQDSARFIPAGAGNRVRTTRRRVRASVHPRGCGEQSTVSRCSMMRCGSSPRVRGTVHEFRPGVALHRFIPAGAGNSPTQGRGRTRPTVHPRGCGEQSSSIAPEMCEFGSSPRVRGTGSIGRRNISLPRFIPAGAGNRSCSRTTLPLFPVHPRGCGEQQREWQTPGTDSGSSPRVRGTDPGPGQGLGRIRFIPAGAGNRPPGPCSIWAMPVHPRGCGEQSAMRTGNCWRTGSSPRVRGTGDGKQHSGQRHRFIPAGAGNSLTPPFSRSSTTVHPRGCGEQVFNEFAQRHGIGSSPRVRGTGYPAPGSGPGHRFIPAGAGNSAQPGLPVSAGAVHPRGCGEQIKINTTPIEAAGSSPRVRGTALPPLHRPAHRRFIPAGAGNSASSAPSACASPVHPRGCGEQRFLRSIGLRIAGSSPWVRGTDPSIGSNGTAGRFIPAGAGNSSVLTWEGR